MMTKGLFFLGAAISAAIVASAPASAATFENTFNVGSPNFQITSGTPFSPTITAVFFNGFDASGTFEDTFLFTIPQDGFGSGNISTSFTGSNTLLTITQLIINGDSFEVPSTGSGQGFSVNGLPIKAFAQNSVQVFGTISGSGTYSGNLTFEAATAGAVPEPAVWTMMIAGFGLVGGAMRMNTKRALRTVAA